MLKVPTAVLFLTSAAAWAQPAITPPRLGFVEDSARMLRPAYGLPGNFILGPSIANRIVSEAFSGSLGLLKTESSLAAFDSQGKLLGSVDAGPGPALFAFSHAGLGALAFIPSANALLEWRAGAFAQVSFNYEAIRANAVLAVAFPTPFEASLMVQRNDTIWELILPLGRDGTAAQHALIGVHSPLVVLPSGDLVYPDTTAIIVRRSDASEVRIGAQLPAHFSLQQMNQDWVQLIDRNSRARFAIRTTPGREAFYQLPE